MAAMTGVCSVEGCIRAAKARGLCGGHYARLRIHGDVLADRPLQAQPRREGCAASGCDREHYAHGWCQVHWSRWRRTGHADAAHPIEQRHYAPDDALRTRTVIQPNGCEVWTGGLNHHGYGSISIGEGREQLVHRYVWEQNHGPVPDGHFIDHTCHNRACVNVDHLRLATRQQNQANRAGVTTRNRTSGVRNVYPVRDRWGVYIGCRGRKYYFGTYDTIAQATEVAEAKRHELFGAYAGKS